MVLVLPCPAGAVTTASDRVSTRSRRASSRGRRTQWPTSTGCSTLERLMVTGALDRVVTLMPRLLLVYALTVETRLDLAHTLATMERVEIENIPNDRVRGEPHHIMPEHGERFGLDVIDCRRVVAGHD